MRLDVGGSSARLADGGPPGLYIVRNPELEDLLFDRNCIGVRFRAACLGASKQFVRHIADEFESTDTAELVILSKGIMYQLAQAFADVTGENLPTNLIATSRVSVSSENASIAIKYSQIVAPASTLVIGDTVASGATIIQALATYLEHFGLKRAYIMSYAGSGVGATRIAEFCRRRAIECIFLYGLASFGLGENGFDLSFLHPDTETDESYRQRASTQFANKAVSAVGWDFGSQTMAPLKYKHLSWVESQVWQLDGAACFATAQEPTNLDGLAHERQAFEGKWPK